MRNEVVMNEAELNPGSSWFRVLRKKSAAGNLFDDKHNIDEFGSTVGSRLWKSTLAVKRNRKSSHQRYSSIVNHLLDFGSGDAHLFRSTGPRGSYIRHKNSLIADPFQRIDIFFSASLANLGPRDAYFIPQSVIGRNEGNGSGQLDGSQHNLPGQNFIRSSSALHGRGPGSHHHLSIGSANNLHPHYIDSSFSIKPYGDRLISSDRRLPTEEMGSTELGSMRTDETCTHRFRDRVVQLFDLNLFTNVHFLFLLLIGVTNQLAYFIPFVYLVDYTRSKGLQVNQAVVISVILGSLHTVGRILSGFAANMPWIDTVYLSGFGTLATALTHLALPLLFPINFAALAGYATLSGMFSVPMIHLLLVRFLGLERLTASYSNLNLIKGIASVIGPMVAVGLVEYTGERGHYFLVAGVCFLLSAFAHLGLCRFPCSKPRDNEDAIDDRARCCFCFSPGAKPSHDEELQDS
ncbi:unnamed protein product [Echinostoma caproni]|uniref:MFS domain-containing protein n=1 Tax=Echinostoma caproni TaxID=27848 RepID=A0A3P8KJE4_9TREM|nr:unnamed protein product [Echinostoma caproni]